MEVEFEKVFNMKLVELEILKISYLGHFSSCYMFLEVILKNSFEVKSLGGCYSRQRIRPGQQTAWALASRRGLPRPSRAPHLASSSPGEAPCPST
jgi:hypothetical protein